MARTADPAPASTRSLRRALLYLGVSGLVFGAAELALTLPDPVGPRWAIAAFTLVGWTYLAAGLTAWWQRPSNRIGAVMLLGAAAWLLAGLVNTPSPALVAVGAVFATVPLAVAVHLLHAFPGGRPVGAPARITVVTGYVVAVAGQAPQYLFVPDLPPYHLWWVADRPDLAAAGPVAQSVVGASVMVATAVLLAVRVRRAAPDRRRVLAPFFAYGVVAVLLVPLSPNVIEPVLGLSPEARVVLQLAVMAGLPAVFAGGVLWSRFARTGEIQELGAWLGAIPDLRHTLREALARTLGDPALRVAYWVPDTESYVDADGLPTTVPAADNDHGVTAIELAGHRVGVIVFDPVLVGDAGLVAEAGRVVAIAADRERLTAELRSSREALRRSRERIVAAGDRERRRIARDLHDGLQVRMLLMGVRAEQLAQDWPVTGPAALALRTDIDEAAAELRRVVQSIMPAALIERGLAAAALDLIDRIAVPTDLHLDVEDRLPPEVERAAYFILAESLANALKHAQARRLTVRLARADRRLIVQVTDDGIGHAGPTTGPNSGSGLRGLADRADVLGGRLTVAAAPGGGTSILAELPCGS